MTAIDLFGPTVGAGGVTTRPGDNRAFSTSDTFFKDCTSDTIDDGTEYQAAFFNELLANIRTLARGNGQTAGSVDIVTQDNSDDGLLLKAIQNLIQRGQPCQAVDSGSADAMVVALSPALVEYKQGMVIWIKKSNAANATTAPTANLNALGPKVITKHDGSAVAVGDLAANAWLPYTYDLTSDKLRVLVPVGSDFQTGVPLGNPTLYVRTDGNDSNNGSANDSAHAFATIQAALTYAQNVWSLGGKILNIQLGNAGTYTGWVNIRAPQTGISITGDPANQGSYIIAPPSSGSANSGVVVASGISLTLTGVTVSTGRTDCHAIEAAFGASITCTNVTAQFTSTTIFDNYIGTNSGSVVIGAGCIAQGNAGAAVYGALGGNVAVSSGANLTLVGTPTYSVATAVAFGGTINLVGGITGSAIGPQYSGSQSGIFATGGKTIPGSTAGTLASNATYS